MKLLRSERGLIVAIVVIAATVALALGKIDGREYAAVLTMCLQAVITYKAMPAQPSKES